MIILTHILVQVLCVCHQSPKHYIEIWHERPFSLQIQCIVSTIITEWARCCLHSGPTSTTTRHNKGFHNPTTKYLTLHKYPTFVQSTSGSHANEETQPCSRNLLSDQPPWMFPPNTDGNDPPYSQLWLCWHFLCSIEYEFRKCTKSLL